MNILKKCTFVLSALMALLAVTGCAEGKPKSSIDGNSWPNELCIRGVVYYTFGTGGKAAAFKPDGSLYNCNS